MINEHDQEVRWDRSLRGGLEWNEEAGRGQLLAFTDDRKGVRPTWKTKQPGEIGTIDFEGIRLDLFRMKQVPDSAVDWPSSFGSFGLMIDGRILGSGDRWFERDLLDLYADQAEVIFHDVQFFLRAVHPPLSDLKTRPTRWQEKMHLDHYADNFEPQDIAGFAGWTRQGVWDVF